MNDPAFARRREALIGLGLSHIWRGYGSALFVEFGNLQNVVLNGRPLRQPVGDMNIGLGWTWRIEDGTTILAGSYGEEKDWPPVFERLLGRKVTDVMLQGRIPELVLDLDNGYRLQTFADYGESADWTIAERVADGSAGLHLHWEAGALKESP